MARTTDRSLRPRNFPRMSFLDDFFNTDWPSPAFDWNNGFGTEWIPSANVMERDKEFALELSVPGYEKKDIHVEVDDNNILHISGERKKESKEEKENYTRREFSHGSFNRSFQLPEAVNAEKISAQCKNGVLSLQLPKKETALLKKKTKEIQIA